MGLLHLSILISLLLFGDMPVSIFCFFSFYSSMLMSPLIFFLEFLYVHEQYMSSVAICSCLHLVSNVYCE